MNTPHKIMYPFGRQSWKCQEVQQLWFWNWYKQGFGIDTNKGYKKSKDCFLKFLSSFFLLRWKMHEIREQWSFLYRLSIVAWAVHDRIGAFRGECFTSFSLALARIFSTKFFTEETLCSFCLLASWSFQVATKIKLPRKRSPISHCVFHGVDVVVEDSGPSADDRVVMWK